MFRQFNANPQHNRVGDCVIRAISKLTGKAWKQVYLELMLQGYYMADMPSSNAVWGAYLRDSGYKRAVIPAEYEGRYTVKDFCNEHKRGEYLLAISGHVVAVADGEYYDTWDSGDEIPVYYWFKE